MARFGLTLAERAPEVELVPRRVRTPAGEKTVLVPEGIDPGFGYNAGVPTAALDVR